MKTKWTVLNASLDGRQLFLGLPEWTNVNNLGPHALTFLHMLSPRFEGGISFWERYKSFL